MNALERQPSRGRQVPAEEGREPDVSPTPVMSRSAPPPWKAFATPGLALLLLLLSLALRVVDTDAMVNVDMYHLWSKRIVRFMESVSSGDFAHTYQSHHPGVLFMWLAGLLWKFAGVLELPLNPYKLSLATLPVAVVGALLPALSFWLVQRILGRDQRPLAFLVGALLATEPIFIAHSRNAHLDMLVTTLAWLSVLAAILTLREQSKCWAIGSGVLLGLALLTKLSGAGFALGIALLFLRDAQNSHGARRLRQLRLLFTIAAVAGVVFVLLWPALWVSPFGTLEKLWFGVHREMDKTSEFMLLGRTGKLRLPIWTYALFLLFLVTPEFLGFAFVGAALARRSDPRRRALAIDLFVATLPLVLLLVSSARIGNRYLIPILPLVGTLAAIGMVGLVDRMQHLRRKPWKWQVPAGLALLLVLGRCVRALALHPLPITYCSNWGGVDCSSVFHVGWGEGMRQAAQIVAEQTTQRGWTEPPKVYGSGYASLLHVWTPIASTKSIAAAQLLVEYLPDRQRRLKSAQAIADIVRSSGRPLLGEVHIAGRAYVRIFAGPKY